jgi:hypothetical protein
MITLPILDNKQTSHDSVFTASSLFREARRQKYLQAVATQDALAVLASAVSALWEGIGAA